MKRNGFSIIELIAIIFIIVLILLAAVALQSDIFSLNTTVSDKISAQNEIRRAFKQMTAEIRSASSSSLGAYPISDLGQTSFVFYSDADGDGLKERIRYFLDGSILKKGILKPSENPIVYNPANETISNVAQNVSNGAEPIFSYYDKNYDGATAPMAYPIDVILVRLVKITVIIDQTVFTTQVSIRNLKDNL